MKEKYSFGIAIFFGFVAMLGPGFFELIFPSDSFLLPENLLMGYFILTPYGAINFLGFGFTKKNVALSMFLISTAVIFAVSILGK